MSKLISTFKIRFDDETKAEIASLKGRLDDVARALSVKNNSHSDRLLAAMQAEAANDPNSAKHHRETINDVDYLSSALDESVPYIDNAVNQNDWLSKSVPQITQADMQLIFIKNLSECLIQRMHSMDRFSEDDYAIGGDKLLSWDIVIYEPLNAYAVAIARPKPKVADFLFFWESGASGDAGWNTDSEAFKVLRTITEAELPAFRAALEACYA